VVSLTYIFVTLINRNGISTLVILTKQAFAMYKYRETWCRFSFKVSIVPKHIFFEFDAQYISKNC
ncbi:MAG TPA: hypothetical protein VF540_01990, partial [Segetibacter sp.]